MSFAFEDVVLGLTKMFVLMSYFSTFMQLVIGGFCEHLYLMLH
jgi:hypothetical protein